MTCKRVCVLCPHVRRSRKDPALGLCRHPRLPLALWDWSAVRIRMAGRCPLDFEQQKDGK